MLSQSKINLFCVFGRIEQIIILSFKQTESDEINTLCIFGSFILSVKERVQNLAHCKHSCKHWPFLYYRQIIHLVELCQFNFCLSDSSSDEFSSIKMGNRRIVQQHSLNSLKSMNNQTKKIMTHNSSVAHFYTRPTK